MSMTPIDPLPADAEYFTFVHCSSAKLQCEVRIPSLPPAKGSMPQFNYQWTG
jgi:hypothetical protein